MLHLARRVISATREGRLIPGLRGRISPRRGYLRRCHGVIHVGAHIGQERDEYASHNLSVIWIEPIPSIFAELERNIRGYANQAALNALILDVDGRSVTMHVSGVFSSALAPHKTTDIWPVDFTRDVTMPSNRLPTVLRGRDLDGYDALVLDTQGSELLILRGAGDLLSRFRYIECEAATFEAYRDCALMDEVVSFLKERHFRLMRKDLLARHPGGGRYYDLLFRRSNDYSNPSAPKGP